MPRFECVSLSCIRMSISVYENVLLYIYIYTVYSRWHRTSLIIIKLNSAGLSIDTQSLIYTYLPLPALLELSLYNTNIFRFNICDNNSNRWVNNTKDWKSQLASKSLRWFHSWNNDPVVRIIRIILIYVIHVYVLYRSISKSSKT